MSISGDPPILYWSPIVRFDLFKGRLKVLDIELYDPVWHRLKNHGISSNTIRSNAMKISYVHFKKSSF